LVSGRSAEWAEGETDLPEIPLEEFRSLGMRTMLAYTVMGDPEYAASRAVDCDRLGVRLR
jgi:hypothetical protein